MRSYLIALVLMAGCSPGAGYVAADRATFEAVSPEYLKYLAEDGSLDEDQVTRRRATVGAWQARLEQAEGTAEEGE